MILIYYFLKLKTNKLGRAFSLSSSSGIASAASSANISSTTTTANTTTQAGVTASLLNSYGIIHDEWAETSYLSMNILMNVLASTNVEICAQASAKINTILHSRTITSCEEACYFIASVEDIMFERLNQG